MNIKLTPPPHTPTQANLLPSVSATYVYGKARSRETIINFTEKLPIPPYTFRRGAKFLQG